MFQLLGREVQGQGPGWSRARFLRYTRASRPSPIILQASKLEALFLTLFCVFLLRKMSSAVLVIFAVEAMFCFMLFFQEGSIALIALIGPGSITLVYKSMYGQVTISRKTFLTGFTLEPFTNFDG